MSEHDPATHLPNRTTPTWEVELLISGVAVFAMLQLPGLLDDAMFRLSPRFGDEVRQMLVLAYVYAKGMALILAVTFVLHLLLRARWIALVGMHSVYPEGIRWENLRMGPILRDIERARARPFAAIIERADNLAAMVFAVGVTLAIFVVPIAIVAIGISAIGFALSALSGKQVDVVTVMLAVFAIVLLPASAAMMLDKQLGEKLSPDGFVGRMTRRMLGIYARIGFSRTRNPIMALLGSHVSDTRISTATVGLLLVALMVSALSLVAARSPEKIGNYSLFPAATHGNAIASAHYDDQRDPARDEAVPYMQSMVVAGPYLKLVVPFRPNLDEPAMRDRCPQATVAKGDGLAAARLACLQSLHGVALDGKPLDVQYEPGSDPRTDRPALVAMIDVRDLPRGRHELQVAHPPESSKKRRDDPGFDRIPFWK